MKPSLKDAVEFNGKNHGFSPENFQRLKEHNGFLLDMMGEVANKSLNALSTLKVSSEFIRDHKTAERWNEQYQEMMNIVRELSAKGWAR